MAGLNEATHWVHVPCKPGTTCPTMVSSVFLYAPIYHMVVSVAHGQNDWSYERSHWRLLCSSSVPQYCFFLSAFHIQCTQLYTDPNNNSHFTGLSLCLTSIGPYVTQINVLMRVIVPRGAASCTLKVLTPGWWWWWCQSFANQNSDTRICYALHALLFREKTHSHTT